MPSERFFKLDPEKQQRICQAAKREFSRTNFEEASINRIIKDADISRGSFYTYFIDKMDILQYMILDFKDRFLETITELLDEENGDIFRMSDRLYENMLRWGKSPEFDMIKNILSDVQMLSKILDARETGKSIYSSRDFIDFCSGIYEHTNHDLICVNKENFPFFTEMVLAPTIRCAMHTCGGFKDKKKLRESYEVQMQIIQNGIKGKGNRS